MNQMRSALVTIVLVLCLTQAEGFVQTQRTALNKIDSLLVEVASTDRFMGCLTVRKNDLFG
jgi:hypothetical protein